MFSTALLGAGVIAIAALSPASAAQTTVSGTLVDVAKWVSNSSSTVTLNMPAVMMSGMMGTTAGAGGMMSGSTTDMSSHHPSGGGMPNQASPMGGAGNMGDMSNMMGAMAGCHATLGIVTSGGELYMLLANQTSPMGALALCSQVGQRVTVTGTTYNRGGVRALLVSKLEQ
jgi:hypothetical protein